MKMQTVLRSSLLVVLMAMNYPSQAQLSQVEMPQQHAIPPSMQVDAKLAAPVAGVTDLKFNEFYKVPVGPKGLELTSKLIDLVGKKIRIVGYMAKGESAIPGLFVLSPIPVELGDADESLVDDFPPNVLFVHMDESQLIVPHIEGLINLTGILQVGGFEEADGHVSTFRLMLDPAIVKDLKHALASASAAK